MTVLSDRASILTVLQDPGYDVLPAPPASTGVGLGWLRATGPRFSTGDAHERRRALAVADLASVEPDALRRAAMRHSVGHPLAVSAYRTPVAVLATALGVRTPVTALVARVAPWYPTGRPAESGGSENDDTDDADAAVAGLVTAFGGSADERTAARIALLVQAYDATARLILGAAEHGGIETALAVAPPVPLLRRQAGGMAVVLDIATAARDGGDPGLAFGAGLRPCPGRAHALALAVGVLSTVVGHATVVDHGSDGVGDE